MDTTSLVLGLIFSSIGLGYFLYGKKQKHSLPFVSGLILMIYPYFISNHAWLVVIGLICCTMPILLKNFD